MSRRDPRGAHVLLVLLLALLHGVAALPAQQVSHRIDFGGGERVSYQIDYVRPGVRQCSWAYLRVDVRNETSRVRSADVEFDSYWSNRVGSSLGVELEPGESRQLFLPIPMVGADGYYRIRTGGTQETIQSGVDISFQYPPAWSLLLVGARLDEGSWHAASKDLFGSRAEQIRSVRPEDLPPNWWLLSGADVVVVDGADLRFDAVAQSVLDQLLRSGGSLVVVDADRLPEGPLKERVPDSGERTGVQPVGMGTLLTLDYVESGGLPGARWTSSGSSPFAGFLPRSFGEQRAGAAENYAAPLASGAFGTLEIPGLGEVPLRLFFLILLGFALVAGPWNYYHYKRARRLPMLLLTVPALGFGVTAVILLWGLFAEGLGTKQTHRSFTVLDQVTHEATCWSQRSVYAALGASELRPAAGTALAALPILEFEQGRALQWEGGNRFAGSLVPSRSISPLATAGVTTERSRLRFRRGQAAGYEVLADAALPVVDEVGSVVVRDANGRFFANVATPGRVEPIDLETARNLLGRSLSAWTRMPLAPVASSASTYAIAPIESFARRIGVETVGVAHAEGFPSGHYLVRTERPVAHDDLGLDAEELRGAHLVFGRLGEEDFVD